jgi:thioester reductase-like protein
MNRIVPPGSKGEVSLARIRLAITGVTGFVGQALLSGLLDVPEVNLILFCRPGAMETASERITG